MCADFTLVVMTHNRPASLQRCLESIARLDFPESRFTTIVVDDGSRPAAAATVREVVGRHRAELVRIEHSGVATARNVGWHRARGDYVGFLADDFELPTSYLRTVASFFERRPSAEVVSFNLRTRGTHWSRHIQQLYTELVLLHNASAEPDGEGVVASFTLPASRAAVFQVATLRRHGGFDETLRAGEDGDLGRRLAAAGTPVHFLPNVYIDHHEDKNLAGFLRQRRDYATSLAELARRDGSATEGSRWTFLRAARRTAVQMARWWRTSRRYGRARRFVLLSPGLVLFLGSFCWTFYKESRRERSAS